MILIYNTLLRIVLLIMAPFFIITAPFLRKRRGTILKRAGLIGLPDNRNSRITTEPIWVHALSVGEVMSAIPLVKKLKHLFPERQIWISATTKTGFNTAHDKFKDTADRIFYSGYDFSFTVNRIINRINPGMVIVVESDIWPNFMKTLAKKKIPAVLVNARLSERTFAGYNKFSFFMRPTLKRFTRICTQTNEDARRFLALGLPEDKISVTGNIKFDQVFPPVLDAEKAALLSALRLDKKSLIIVAGSTHPGEEQILAEALTNLKRKFKNLFLIVAPRDPARAKQVEEVFQASGLSSSIFSNIKSSSSIPADVVVIDTIGLLQTLYAISDISFIGGSLVDFRGHNPLEPAAYSKPILFGPYMADFKAIAAGLTSVGGAFLVRNAAEFMSKALTLLKNPAQAKTAGEHASEMLAANHGSVDNLLTIIVPFLNKTRSIEETAHMPPNIIRALVLFPLTATYRTAALLRRYLYQSWIIKPKKLPCRVISVGNITTGGTGKTPMTIYIARRLKKMGLSPAIVSRGYRGHASKRGGIVSDGNSILMNAAEAGDEPLMMAQILNGVPVVVGRHKYQAAKTAISHFEPDVILLDDGFQHFQLARDLNILLMDSTKPVGNGWTLPAGNLREPVSCLRHADIFAFTRADSPPDIPRKTAGYVTGKPVVNTRHQQYIAAWVTHGSNQILSPELIGKNQLKNKRAFVFCGLAKNESFLTGTAALLPDIEIVGYKFFRDHHWYSNFDLFDLSKQATELKADIMITSEKDYARISNSVGVTKDLMVLGVKIVFDDPAHAEIFDELLITGV